MKKVLSLTLMVLMVFLVVSCATTKGADIPDAVRVIDAVSLVNDEPVMADQLWSVFADLIDESDLSDDMKMDEASKTIVMNNITLASNVGALASDGEVVVKGTLTVEDGKVTAVVSFVDAYTYYQMGPISKKVSVGLTDLGMKAYDAQTGWLLDVYENLVAQAVSVYGIQAGWYGEEAQKAYQEALANN